MVSTQAGLLNIARMHCMPFLLNLPVFAERLDRLSFAIVGSVANNTCREGSDIDIAAFCEQDLFNEIPTDTPWGLGRPSEVILDGTQLHYYVISYEMVEDKLNALDDAYIYNYANMVILHNLNAQIERLEHSLSQCKLARTERAEGKLDMLLRRYRALKQLGNAGDVMTVARMGLEIATLCLKVAALLDNTPFDPRKRLFETALRGSLGQRIDNQMRELISSVGSSACCCSVQDSAEFTFISRAELIIKMLSEEAANQGYKVGLPKPDHRHAE